MQPVNRPCRASLPPPEACSRSARQPIPFPAPRKPCPSREAPATRRIKRASGLKQRRRPTTRSGGCPRCSMPQGKSRAFAKAMSWIRAMRRKGFASLPSPNLVRRTMRNLPAGCSWTSLRSYTQRHEFAIRFESRFTPGEISIDRIFTTETTEIAERECRYSCPGANASRCAIHVRERRASRSRYGFHASV